MESASTAPSRAWAVRAGAVKPAAVATWLVPFLLVVYLALRGGGYDGVVRGEAGIAVWWITLVGLLVGILPRARLTRSGWAALGLLAAFTAWTTLGTAWSESVERSMAEAGRLAMYLGVFALALAVQGPVAARRTVNGVAAAVTVVAGLAVLSRLHPAWFPANETATFLPNTLSRLGYPLNYWNGLAALAALGLPLVLQIATSARTIVGRALGAAALPLLALCIFLTFSRGGALAAAVGLGAFFVLAPDRLPKLATALAGAAGSAILIAAVQQRDALEHGLRSAAAARQGDEVLAIAIAACLGVALVQAGIALAVRHGRRPGWLTVSPGRARILTLGLVVGALVAAVAAGLPGAATERWKDFKNPGLGVAAKDVNTTARFESASGNGRYQLWSSAADANAIEPLQGIGPGTFEYWWARNGTLNGFVRNAHSLYAETLGESGLVGLGLVVGLILLVLATGARRSLRRRRSGRTVRAAATAGCAAFAVSAGVDWVWQIAVLPTAFLLLAAVAISRPASAGTAPPRVAPWHRALLAGLGAAALIAIAIPLASAAALRDSQRDAASSSLPAALGAARSAQRVEPYAASPQLQEALVLEEAGDFNRAAGAAASAARREPTNWRTWFVRARLEAERGRPRAALEAYRRARSLNPRSTLFAP